MPRRLGLVALPDAILRPVREGNAFETTVEHLATAIRLGVFATGERLPPERELAERLKVGRATLREAIAALRLAGLVTTTRGRAGGTVVVYRGPSSDAAAAGEGPAALRTLCRTPAEVADALAFRRVVEPGAAALAAGADLSAESRTWLCEALDEAGAAAADDGRRLADTRLHLAVATLTGSPLVIDAVRQAQVLLREMLAAIPVLRANIEHSTAQHEAIVAAILRGDPDGAGRTMQEHCDATSALIRGLLG